MKSVLVIGAGAAGLYSANILAQGGVSVTLLEAQERLGGRIHSLLSPEIAAPVELGAEFIHGLGPELWELVGAANLATHEVPVQQWRFENGHLVQDDSSFEDFEKLIKLADAAGPDMPFSGFLESHPDRRK